MDERSSGFIQPLLIHYYPPRWLPALVAAAVVFSAISVLVIPVSVTVKGLSILLIGLLTQREITRTWHEQTRLLLDSNDRWTLMNAKGKEKSARLVTATISQPGFIVLILEDTDGRRFPFILTSADLDATLLRRLRTRLYHPLVGD